VGHALGNHTSTASRQGCSLGSEYATSVERLKAIAAKHGVHHVDNALGGLAAG
jgi:hypothetical protein